MSDPPKGSQSAITGKSSKTNVETNPSKSSLAKAKNEKRTGPPPTERRAWGLTGGMVAAGAAKTGCFRPNPDDENLDKTDFIYGGPFAPKRKVDGFLNTATPLNVQQSGIYKQSYAYKHLKDILPIILTKIVNSGSKGGDPKLTAHVSKLKSDLVTNKPFEEFAPQSADSEEWNGWIRQLDVANKKPFHHAWAWTESYVYRKVFEGAELANQLNMDYFSENKSALLREHIEPMCVIAERLIENMCIPKEDKKERKDDFSQLCKVSMWATRFGMPVTLGHDPDPALNVPNPILPLPKPGKPPKKPKKGAPPGPPPLTDVGYFDPFQINLDLKSNTLLDDSGKALDLLEKRSVKLKTQREKFLAKCQAAPGELSADIQLVGDGKKKKEKKPKPPPPDPNAPPPEPPPRVVCPAKRTAPDVIYLDIVANNAGYELFTDLCIAHYALCQELVEKVRIHVKKYPWFILDATERDLRALIDTIKTASFSKTSNPPPPTKPTEEPREPRNISASYLNQLGQKWAQYIDDGTFIICTEDYWTYPHTYTVMKKYDIYLYKKLQCAALIIWKGDLNYRKLLGDRNCVPTDKFEPCLQGFLPAPHLAIRTIKSEILCGLPKGRKEQMNENFTEEWIQTGNFGTIQISKKAEAMPKKPDRPCEHYGDTCFSEICPTEPALPPPPPPPPVEPTPEVPV